MEKKDEKEFKSKITEGDIIAYQNLFNMHFTDLCRFIRYYIKSPEISEDIAQEVFTQVWEKRESLTIRSSIKTFLFISARNKAISYYRKHKMIHRLPLEKEAELLVEHCCAHNSMENYETGCIIDSAINQLPNRCRDIFCMAWKNELSYKEIASKLGVKPKTVENHMTIALRRLRKYLTSYYENLYLLNILLIVELI